MRFHKKSFYLATLLIFTVVTLLSGCSNDNLKQIGMEAIESTLKAQIDKIKDDYLMTLKDEEVADTLKLNSVYYDSFTKQGEKEILALFKMNAPHVFGIDRTIAAIYDSATLKLKSQKTLSADNVSIFLYPTRDNKKNILYIGDVTYQGQTEYSIDLFEINESGWISKPVSTESFESNFSFGVTNDKLQVFQLSYNDYVPVYSYMYTLFWNTANGTFEKELF